MEEGGHGVMIANERITVGSNSYGEVKSFKYLGSSLKNKNSVQEKMKCRLKKGNSCHYSAQTFLSFRLLFKFENKNI